MHSSPGGQAESGEGSDGEEGEGSDDEEGEGSEGGGVDGGGGARNTGGVFGGREEGEEGEAEFRNTGVAATGSSVERIRDVGESNIPEISIRVDSGRDCFVCSTVWCTVTPGEEKSSLSSSLPLSPTECAAAPTLSSVGGKDSGTSCRK